MGKKFDGIFVWKIINKVNNDVQFFIPSFPPSIRSGVTLKIRFIKLRDLPHRHSRYIWNRLFCISTFHTPAYLFIYLFVSIHTPLWGATANSANMPPQKEVSIHTPLWGMTLKYFTKDFTFECIV